MEQQQDRGANSSTWVLGHPSADTVTPRPAVLRRRCHLKTAHAPSTRLRASCRRAQVPMEEWPGREREAAAAVTTKRGRRWAGCWRKPAATAARCCSTSTMPCIWWKLDCTYGKGRKGRAQQDRTLRPASTSAQAPAT